MFYEVLMEKRAEKEERSSARDYAPAGALTAAGLGSAGYGGYRLAKQGPATNQAIAALDKLIELKNTQGKAVTDGASMANSYIEAARDIARDVVGDDVADQIEARRQQAQGAIQSAQESLLDRRRGLERMVSRIPGLSPDKLDKAVLDSPDALREHLAGKRMKGRAMVGGGLAAAGLGGKMLYDRYRDRQG